MYDLHLPLLLNSSGLTNVLPIPQVKNLGFHHHGRPGLAACFILTSCRLYIAQLVRSSGMVHVHINLLIAVLGRFWLALRILQGPCHMSHVMFTAACRQRYVSALCLYTDQSSAAQNTVIPTEFHCLGQSRQH